MRVLFVTNRYPTEATPGDSPCIAQQRADLNRAGHCVDVLFIDSRRSPLNYLWAMWRVFWLVQVCGKYDMLHAHYGYYTGLAACAQWRIPLVVTFRGSDVLRPRELRVSRVVARRARQVIVMSEQMETALGSEDAAVIPYGVNLEVFRPSSQHAARARLGLPSQVPLLLFPYDPERGVKRFDMVQAVVQLLKPQFPALDVVAVYDKPYQDVPLYMNACDLLVLTSNSEGAPVAIREAMACNLPIVSVDVGDVRETIGSTEHCHIVERDPNALAKCVESVLNTRPRSNGRNTARSMSTENAAEAVVDIYNRLHRTRRTGVQGQQPNKQTPRNSSLRDGVV